MVTTALRASAAALLGLVFAIRLADGSMRALVQTWYEPVLVAAAVVLLLCAAVAAWPAALSMNRETIPLRPRALVGAALVCMPIAAGLAFQPSPLNSKNLTDASGVLDGRAFSQSASVEDPARRNIYQWAYEFARTDPHELLNSPVDLIGFVHVGRSEDPHRFGVARFVVACCVADATGYILPVESRDALTFAENDWVRIQGRVAFGQDGSLVVAAESIEGVNVPSSPYIYP